MNEIRPTSSPVVSVQPASYGPLKSYCCVLSTNISSRRSSHCAVAPLSKQKRLQRPPEFIVRYTFRSHGRLFHRPGPTPADENALSPKVLNVRVTTHVRLTHAQTSSSKSFRLRHDTGLLYNTATLFTVVRQIHKMAR